MRRLVGLVFVFGLGACGGASRHYTISTSAAAEYPCVLHPPASLPGSWLVRQRLTITAQREGRPVTGELEAVLQKEGEALTIVGLGPLSVRAFTLVHRGERIEVEQHLGGELPFSPRNVVVDVHRVYWKRLPGAPPADGVRRGELDGEQLEETWRGGELVALSFTRPGAFRGAVRVELGPGCSALACEPTTATLHNEWFHYTLEIENDAYERLP